MATSPRKPDAKGKRVRRATKSMTDTSTVSDQGVGERGASAGAIGMLITRGVRHQDITDFLRQLIMLLEAGTPILKSLTTLAERLRGTAVRVLAADVVRHVEAGNPLWQAFERHPRYFNMVFVNLVKASEASGTLVPVLKRLVMYRQRREMIRKRVQGAMVYPVILVVICFAVLMLMSRVVIPQFKDLFTHMDMEIPRFTVFFIGVMEFLGSGWTWLWALVALGVLGVLYRVWVQNPLNRVRADRLKLKIPIMGPILRKYTIVQFTRTLSLLLRSGLSIMVTLDLVRNAISNRAFGQMLQSVRDSVERGGGLSEPLSDAPDLVPPVVADLLVTGEEAGSLDDVAEHVADTYEEEVNIQINAIGESLQPILTVLIGVMVGLLAYSFFGPMIGMLNQLSEAGNV